MAFYPLPEGLDKAALEPTVVTLHRAIASAIVSAADGYAGIDPRLDHNHVLDAVLFAFHYMMGQAFSSLPTDVRRGFLSSVAVEADRTAANLPPDFRGCLICRCQEMLGGKPARHELH